MTMKKDEKIEELTQAIAARDAVIDQMVAERALYSQQVVPAEEFGDPGGEVCNGCLHIGGGMARGECAECKVIVLSRAARFSPVSELLDRAKKAHVKVEEKDKQLVHNAKEGSPLADELDRFALPIVRKLRGL